MTENKRMSISGLLDVLDTVILLSTSHIEYAIQCNILEDLSGCIKELEQYRAIGTVEEFKALKEKSVARKIRGTRFEEAICPSCESELFDTYWAFGGIHYCSNCGQAIDWQ